MTLHEDLANLTVRTHEQDAKVYVCRWGKFGGWAVASVHDGTCMLGIVSDHGNWAFNWNHGGLGKGVTLHEFLTRCGGDYVANKLVPVNQRKEVDFDETRNGFIRDVLQCRRDGKITREVARERWCEATAWGESEYQRQEFPDWFEDVYDCIRHRPTYEFTAFVELVWPAVQRAITEEVARRSVLADVGVP